MDFLLVAKPRAHKPTALLESCDAAAYHLTSRLRPGISIARCNRPQLRLLRLGLAFLLACACGCHGYQPQGVDPYEVLALKRGGDSLEPAVLKRAYRKAALRWHPDKVPESERKEAEQKFIEIAWAYEVLSDPSKRSQYDQPGQQAPPGGDSGPGDSFPKSESARSFSMEEAAKVFQKEFGTTSAEYQDLINHLMASSGTGDKAQWQKHAKAIAKELKKKGGTFSVETKTKDGRGKLKTQQTETRDGNTVTRKTVTESVQTTANGPGASPHLAGGTNPALDAHSAHMAAHEAAVKAAQDAAARMHTQALGGMPGMALPGQAKKKGEL